MKIKTLAKLGLIVGISAAVVSLLWLLACIHLWIWYGGLSEFHEHWAHSAGITLVTSILLCGPCCAALFE